LTSINPAHAGARSRKPWLERRQYAGVLRRASSVCPEPRRRFLHPVLFEELEMKRILSLCIAALQRPQRRVAPDAEWLQRLREAGL
jgi:hypothetical protein